MKKVVTHNGRFHADEIFGVATLQLALGVDRFELIRTRDEAVIQTADIVLDVGGEYDPARCRFDHHQPGAPVRDNGIPFAAFGLVWKEYGEQVCASAEIVQKIEQKLVQPIDAGDNGVALYTLNEYKLAPIELSSFLESFMPPLGTGGDEDAAFRQAVIIAREYLERVIKNYQHKAVLKAEAARVYEAAADKRVLVFDTPMKRGIFSDFEDVFVIVTPIGSDSSRWSAQVVPADEESFAARGLFPLSWAGLENEALVAVSGIEGAQFCHKGRFIFVAATKEAAVEAAKIAVG